jgi:serine protease Do
MAPPEKTVVQKTLGLNLANMTDDLRKRYKIKDSVKGVVITGVEAQSPAADKRLNAGDVVVEVSQEAVADTDALQKRVDQLKKEGRKSALLLVANADGELRFVALSLQ